MGRYASGSGGTSVVIIDSQSVNWYAVGGPRSVNRTHMRSPRTCSLSSSMGERSVRAGSSSRRKGIGRHGLSFVNQLCTPFVWPARALSLHCAWCRCTACPVLSCRAVVVCYPHAPCRVAVSRGGPGCYIIYCTDSLSDLGTRGPHFLT